MSLRVRAQLFLVLGIVILGVFPRLELFNPLEDFRFSKEVVAENGELLRLTTSLDEKYRIFRKLAQISSELKESVLLLEDQYFYYHWGVNPMSLFRALGSLPSDRKIGASTITMQLVRLKKRLYTKSFFGKIQQMLWAIGYECVYSKNQILEAYLNLAPYGANIEGVEAASQIYFGKPSRQLDLAEALTLAVIPQNPIKRSLNQEQQTPTDLARERLAHIWLQRHPKDQNVSLEIRLPQISKRLSELPFLAPHFVDRILARDPFSNRLQTTLNWPLQKAFEDRIHSYINASINRGVKNAAAILIDASTNEVKAWVGSADYQSEEIHGQIDGITTHRSPGSTLKPFLYALAMDEGLIHSESLMKDSPSSFGPYDPENFDRSYKGPLSATEALIQSRNIPAVYLASRLKNSSLYSVLKSAGVENLRDEKYYGLAIALGSAELTPENLAGLYSTLYHHGEFHSLRLFSSAEKSKSEIDLPKTLFSKESAFMTLQMLTENPRSESALVDQVEKLKVPVAWKTGTSYGFRDAWTAGLVGPYVLVVWLGNFDYSSNNALIGREVAAPLFFQLIDLLPKKALQQNEEWTNSFGLNLKKVKVCSVSGLLPNEHCPHQKTTWFIPGVSPIAPCELHREVIISKKTGLRLCDVAGYDFKREVFEFWPSDLLQLFARGGLDRKVPPAFDPSCDKNKLALGGSDPQVISPKTDVAYVVSYRRSGSTEQIPLKAIADAEVKELSWFIDRQFVAKASPEQTVLSNLGPGTYEVLVVDDHGRSASRSLQVKAVQ